jgi:hypothetical protein
LTLLGQASQAALDHKEEENPPDWDAYQPLKKAFQPRFKRQPDGGILHLNRNNRWQKWEGTLPEIPQIELGEFQLPVTDGEFGRGVYLQISKPQGYLQLRSRLALLPSTLLTEDAFYALEDDLAGNTDLLLDGQGIRAIAKTEGERITLLCIRNPDDLEILGILSGSGAVPSSAYNFQIVDLDQQPDALILTLEMVPDALPLEKAATKDRRSTFTSQSHLNGTKLLPVHRPPLSRSLVRSAIARCEADGIPFGSVQVCLVKGVPDFLKPDVYAFCLPSDARVCLAPHDPHEAIASLCKRLSMRLRVAVKAKAIDGDDALQILQTATGLSPDWWLEMLIKRYVGAVLAAKVQDVMQGEDTSLWAHYLRSLAGRGVMYWGNRRAIAGCIAEDYRCAHDPAGLPNLVTLEWDQMVPALARTGQQIVSQLLNTSENHVDHGPT